MKMEGSECAWGVLPSSFKEGYVNPQGVFQESEGVIGHE